MKRITIIILITTYSLALTSQRNCNIYKWEGDSCRYEACIFLEEAPRYFQLRKEYHEIYDRAIEICSNYSDAYRAKSVAYLKTGDFITWKGLMDKAVAIDPKEHLGYRGWCHFQFFRDYESAIADIEELDRLTEYNIGYSQNGMYHLNIAKALCYKMIGQKTMAITIIQNQMKTEGYKAGLYDYLHLGVLFLETNQFKKAEKAFLSQLQEYDCAENRYYLALAYKATKQTEMSKANIGHARSLYNENQVMHDPYTHQIDKIYLKDIIAEQRLITME